MQLDRLRSPHLGEQDAEGRRLLAALERMGFAYVRVGAAFCAVRLRPEPSSEWTAEQGRTSSAWRGGPDQPPHFSVTA